MKKILRAHFKDTMNLRIIRREQIADYEAELLDQLEDNRISQYQYKIVFFCICFGCCFCLPSVIKMLYIKSQGEIRERRFK